MDVGERVAHADCRIAELRRYALKPGARDTLIELFDREFIETQEAVGMQLLGQFRDLDDPDSFVWLRCFRDMSTRKQALDAFYGGPVWKEHGSAAGATMLDVGNVLLLRPLSDLELDADGRPAPGATEPLPGLVVVTIYLLANAAAEDFPGFFESELEPAFRNAGISVLATYVTEESENTFPTLPVREDVKAFVWMAMYVDEADHARHLAALEGSRAWHDVGAALARQTAGAPDVLRLTPTARSLIHG